ncbi:MAG: ABC transporter permease [Candidatus Methanomethylophilaceae archaeon]|nr:ABC transporter permease [Candidatus Methanomethylophilaceae archaeon]
MSHLTNIVKKELKELLTPGSVISVVLMMVLFAMLGGLIGGEVEKAKILPAISVVDGDNGEVTLPDGTSWNLERSVELIYSSSIPEGASVSDYIIKLTSTKDAGGNIDYDDLQSKMKSAGTACAMIVPDNFASSIASKTQASLEQFYIYEPTGMFGTAPSSVASTVVSSLNVLLSRALLTEEFGQKDYAFYIDPIKTNDIGTMVNGNYVKDVTPAAIANQVSSQTMLVPMVIMIIIMMVGSIVISSMGSEKENKTLETLLTMPIRRTTIVTGKIIAAALVGLIYGLAYMFGMSFYMNALTSEITSGVSLESIGLGLGLQDYAFLMVSMFLSIICALGLCMILGAFAKNNKSAQTMTLPISILAMIPMFIIMFSGWYGSSALVQALLFIIPFSHPMIAVEALMYNDYALVFSGIGYMAAFAFVAIMVTVRLYNSDILVTGLGQNGFVQRLFGRK